MFRYFPDNYLWSGAVIMGLSGGGQMYEIDKACSRLKDLAKKGGEEGTEAFLKSWSDMAEELASFAKKDEAAGHLLTAGPKFARASVYLQTAERLQNRHYEPRREAYAKSLEYFAKAVHCSQEDCERVEIPYQGKSYPAYFVKAHTSKPRAPTMVFCNGLDSTKEMCFRSGAPQDLAARGISTLVIDQPGTGEALRLRDLVGRHDSEAWATPALEYLLTRADVDPAKIGMMGWSLGGYYAPRAAAFEPRFALCVSWGANYDWGATQIRRLAREGDNPVPHYWDHVQWVFGKSSKDEFMAFAPQMSLVNVIDRIKVPYLITHGEQDTQILLTDADAQYAAAINSPKRELKVFRADEGGIMHISADNKSIASGFISDWIHDTI